MEELHNRNEYRIIFCGFIILTLTNSVNKNIHSLLLQSIALLGLIGLLILSAIGQAAQAYEGDGAATGLNIQATTNNNLVGLNINLPVAQVDKQDVAPFDNTSNVLNLNTLNSAVTANTVTAHTQYQPFNNVIDSDAETVGLNILLSLLSPLGTNLVNLSSDTIASTAQVSGSCGSFTATGSTTIEGLNLSVLNQTVATNLNTTPTPNTVLLNTNININLGLSALSAAVQVILNEQTVAGDQSSIKVNALHIHMDITAAGLTNLTQTVDIIVSRSEAGFTSCQDVDLSASKTTNLSTNATVGVPFDYTVTIENQSANNATTVQFTDTLDSNTTFVSFISQGGGTCMHNSGTITCQWLTVPAGGSVAATYRVNPIAAGTAINNVSVTTSDNDTDPSDNSDSVSVTINPASGATTDLAVSFVNSTPANGQVGVPQDVPIQLTNSGALATNTSLIYTISPGATINSVTGIGSGSCVINGNTLTCGPVDLIDGFDEIWTVNITPTTTGQNTHTVNVTSDIPDPDSSNNTDTGTANVTTANNVDLSVNKTTSLSGNTTVNVPFDYTVTIDNQNINNTATAVQFTDTLDSNTTFVGFINQGDGICNYNSGTITCQWPTVPASGSVVAIYRVNPTAAGTAINNVTVVTNDNDTDPSNNSDSVSVTIDPAGGISTDLAVSFINNTPADGQVGISQNVDIQITNNGALATNTTLIYTISPGATINSVTGTGSSNCTINGNTVTCGPTDVSTGFNGTWITVNITPTTVGQNTHTVNVASDIPDPDLSNNSATETANVTTANDVDLSTSKTTSLSGNATVGVPFDYTVTITNQNASNAATTVQFTDMLDSNTTFVSFISQGGGTCMHNSGTITCQWLTVPAGGSVAATYRVNPIAAGTAINNVSVTTSDNDTDPSDNSDSVSVTINPASGATTDLAVGFVNSTPANGQVGVPQDVQIQLTNSGALATNTSLIYTISPGATINSVTGIGSGSCVISTNTLTCGPVDLIDGFDEIWIVNITPTTTGQNTHTVNVTSDIPDPNSSNNTDTEIVNVIAASSIILNASVTDNPDPGTEGVPVTYTIDISNTGTASANNVILNVELSGVPVTINSVSPGCTITGAQVSCNLGTLNANGNTQVTIVAIPNGVGTLSLSGTVEDDASHSASVTESTSINAAAATADLGIRKTVNRTQILVGESITYTIVVTNGGPSAASNVVVSDTLSSQVAFVSATPTQGSCSESLAVVSCGLGTLSNGSTANIRLVVEAISPGGVSNSATVSSNIDDPNLGDNTDTARTRIGLAPKTIPTLSEYGYLMMIALLAFSAMRLKWNRRDTN